MAFSLMSRTLMPTVSAKTSVPFTRQRPCWVWLAKCSSKWSGLVFMVIRVNQVSSKSLMVRPGQCLMVSPGRKSSRNLPIRRRYLAPRRGSQAARTGSQKAQGPGGRASPHRAARGRNAVGSGVDSVGEGQADGADDPGVVPLVVVLQVRVEDIDRGAGADGPGAILLGDEGERHARDQSALVVAEALIPAARALEVVADAHADGHGDGQAH